MAEEGFIYCIWNKMYGENVYKLGKTIDMQKRLKGYTTSYIDPVEIIHTEKVIDLSKAEQTLFVLLSQHRIKQNREFFSVKQDVIVDAMQKTARLINGNVRFDDDDEDDMYHDDHYEQVSNFIDKFCELGKTKYVVTGELYDKYVSETSDDISKDAFTKILSKQGYAIGKKRVNGVHSRVRIGIGLISDNKIK